MILGWPIGSAVAQVLAGWVERLRTRFLGAVVPAAQLPTHSESNLDSIGLATLWAGRFKNFGTGVV